MTDRTYAVTDEALSQTNAIVPAVFAIALGVFVLFGTGFAAANLLHNAAHDSRHTVGFPCH